MNIQTGDDSSVVTKTYKYRIYPEKQAADFPLVVKHLIIRHARLVKFSWNRLVDARRAAFEDHERTPAAVAKDSEDAGSRLQRREADLAGQVSAICDDPELRDMIPRRMREAIRRRFEKAHREALAAGRELRRVQARFIQDFSFTHRFDGEGVPAPLIHSKKLRQIFIAPVAAEFLTTEKYRQRVNRVVSGTFRISRGKESEVPFRIVLHRPLPPASRIRAVTLTGKARNYVWKYYLVLTVNEPAPGRAVAPTGSRAANGGAVAALDLAWQLHDDYIRFGVVADSSGNRFELRLPISPAKNHSLQRLERMLARYQRKLPAYPQTWKEIEAWEIKNERAIREVKRILEIFPLPVIPKTKPLVNNLKKLRKDGLLKLLHELRKAVPESIEPEQGLPLIKILENWRDDFLERQKAVDFARDRLINRQKNCYRLAAHWLRRRYARVLVGEEIKFPQLVAAACVAGKRRDGLNRNIGNLPPQSRLKKFLTWLAQPAGDQIVRGAQAKSKNEIASCPFCGGAMSLTLPAALLCLNGHEADAGVLAAGKLLEELAADAADSSPAAEQLIIPENLKNIVVQI